MASRLIMLDTETTGLNARLGDRVIEIGCVELLRRSVTERHFHYYVNPGRDIEEGAAKVHGISLEFLADKPKFAEIAREFLDYVQGAAAAAIALVELSKLVVVPASAAEIAAHEKMLDGIDKEAKTGSLWRRILAA